MKQKRLSTFFLTTLFILCGIEILLRLAGNFYLEQFSLHQHNPAPGETTILCLGESSTAGLGVPYPNSYPAQLEQLLRKQYPQKNIHVVVPPLIGQNTSQMVNRVENYLNLYQPQIVLLMAGYNNEWSLAESHIGRFLAGNDWATFQIKTLCLLDHSRLFKLTRYVYLRFIVREDSKYTENLKKSGYLFGGPELVRYPPKESVYQFALENRAAFIQLWRYDVQKIINISQKYHATVILMTYHINPSYLPIEEFIAVAKQTNVPLVRNDLTFENLNETGAIEQYLLKDHWHPNPFGYALIAQNAFAVIKSSAFLEK